MAVGIYGLIKTNTNSLNGFIGVGLNYYTSFGKVEVKNLYKENVVNTYKLKIPSYSNINTYVPLGFEFPLNSKKNVFMKIMGSIHFENNTYDYKFQRLFLNGGFQIQYQL